MTKSQALARVIEAAREMVRVRQSNDDPDIANTKYVRAIIECHIQKLADSIAAYDAAPDEDVLTLAKQFREIDNTGDFIMSVNEIAAALTAAAEQQREEDALICDKRAKMLENFPSPYDRAGSAEAARLAAAIREQKP